MTDEKLPRGIANNNPCNIVWTGAPQFVGEVGLAPKGKFSTFDTASHGIRACGVILTTYQDKHGLNTVNGMIRRYTSTDQDAYVKNVAAALNVLSKRPIDIHNKMTKFTMVKAIIKQENGAKYANYYSDKFIATALEIDHASVGL